MLYNSCKAADVNQNALRISRCSQQYVVTLCYSHHRKFRLHSSTRRSYDIIMKLSYVRLNL